MMDRRKSLKTLLAGTVSAGVILEACNNIDQKKTEVKKSTGIPPDEADRMAEEIIYNEKLKEESFFTKEEMATIAILADIIIPRDEFSGNASDAKVPDFIEFIVKDRPEYKTPMRGGLRWLDLQSLRLFDKSFSNLSEDERLKIVDEIAYPSKVKSEYKQGAAFFNLMRNLTISGFYTTPMGVKDIGYLGNTPNQWNGVPNDVLKQYNLEYTEKELKECISFDKV
jgi:gluconate 2-dehydrogenase gamma chain